MNNQYTHHNKAFVIIENEDTAMKIQEYVVG